MLFTIRTVTIIGLILLLLNPWFNFKRSIEVPRNIDIIFDHSESLKHHYKNSNLEWENIRTKIEYWGDKNDLDMNIYRLGADMQEFADMETYDISTDFSKLGKFMIYEHPDEMLMITDGKATVGRELTDLDLPSGIPIHILGVGPVEGGSDLIIETVDIPLRRFMETDTVTLTVKLESHLSIEAVSKLQIMNDQSDNIYSRTVSFNPGQQISIIKIAIPVVKFSGINNINLLPLNDEVRIENNKYSFRVNIQSSDVDIFLLSGALSPNTSIIKSTLLIEYDFFEYLS